jgi:hypothetical protein
LLPSLRGRLAATAGSVLILAGVLTAGATTALGADTRLIYFGSGPVTDLTTNGDLDFSPVTAGGTTAAVVIVKNIDNQTLTHVTVSIASLPGGMQIAAIDGADSSFCSPTIGAAPVASATCSFGNLAKNKSRTITVVLTAPTAGLVEPAFSISFNESKAPSGSNTHLDEAQDLGFSVGAFSCDTVSTYLRGSATKTLATPCSLEDDPNGQTSTVAFPGSLTTLTLREVGGACPLEDGCIGDAVVADIVGDSTGDVIVWTLQVELGGQNVNLNQLVVYHYNDAGVETPLGGIANTKKNECKTASQSSCIVDASITDDVLTVIYRSDGNGSTRLG